MITGRHPKKIWEFLDNSAQSNQNLSFKDIIQKMSTMGPQLPTALSHTFSTRAKLFSHWIFLPSILSQSRVWPKFVKSFVVASHQSDGSWGVFMISQDKCFLRQPPPPDTTPNYLQLDPIHPSYVTRRHHVMPPPHHTKPPAPHHLQKFIALFYNIEEGSWGTRWSKHRL